MMNMTPVVKQLIIINVIFFIASNFLPNIHAYELFSMYYPENNKFRIWQPITSMFMHAPLPNYAHILFNMIGLFSFGSTLEHFMGGKKFLIFYISCGLGAALLHFGINYFQFHNAYNTLINSGYNSSEIINLLNDGKINTTWSGVLGESGLNNFAGAYATPVLGASGAIYGLFSAFALMFPEAEMGIMLLPFKFKAKYFVPAVLLIDLFLGLKGQSIFGFGSTGIAHFAHIGGAITGLIMIWFWKKNQFNNRRWN